MTPTLRVTYKVSSIGNNQKQRKTVRSLGLYRLHQQVELPDRPEVRAQLKSIQHLVVWEETSATAEAAESKEGDA